MNEEILELKAALDTCFTGQVTATAFWHDTEPQAPVRTDSYSIKNLRNLVILEHYYNFQLWHVEDRARRKDVSDAIIADCKRQVDRLNQMRNDCIEEVDRCLYAILLPHIPQGATSRQNTETPGMALDRLSILALKIYHMEEQTKREDVDEEHIRSCSAKLATLRRQRSDLVIAVLELISDYVQGSKMPALYSQFKMYNDPSLNPELYSQGSR